MLSYRPLFKTMEEKSITKYQLMTRHGFSSHTIYNINHGKGINLDTLERLCDILGCTPNDIIEFVKEE